MSVGLPITNTISTLPGLFFPRYRVLHQNLYANLPIILAHTIHVRGMVKESCCPSFEISLVLAHRTNRFFFTNPSRLTPLFQIQYLNFFIASPFYYPYSYGYLVDCLKGNFGIWSRVARNWVSQISRVNTTEN